MARTGRVYWRARKGRHKFEVSWPGVINFRSVVIITVSEYNRLLPLDLSIPVPGAPPPPLHNDDRLRFVGDANVWVCDIAPHGPDPANNDPGGVQFVINIDWHEPITVVTDIIVIDDPVQHERVFE